MKNSFLLLALYLASHSLFAQTDSTYQLVWADEFNGTMLDLSKWEYMLGDGQEYGLTAWGNNELQWYRSENVIVENGLLKITAKKERYSGKSYTSARIRTSNKGDWTYGRFEIRAKITTGQGIWPAIWMSPTDNEYGTWAASGEIDIMENIGHETQTVHGTLHYGSQWPKNVYTGAPFKLEKGAFANDFHLFSIEWEKGSIKWYVDGKHYQTQTEWYSNDEDFPAPFDQDFHMILNVAVGGNFPGNPDVTTLFPQTMEVDYVRIYQKNSKSPEKPGFLKVLFD